MPVSSISTVAIPSAGFVHERIVIVPPSGVNLIAFLSRFQRIWVMRALSAKMMVFSLAKSRDQIQMFRLQDRAGRR